MRTRFTAYKGLFLLGLMGCGRSTPAGLVTVSPRLRGANLDDIAKTSPHSCVCHVTYGGPRQTLFVVARIEEPPGTVVRETSVSSIKGDGAYQLDADAWVEVVGIDDAGKQRWLAAVRLIREGNSTCSRFWLDDLIPASLEGRTMGGFGSGQTLPETTLPDDQWITLFQGSVSYADRNRILRIGIRFE